MTSVLKGTVGVAGNLVNTIYIVLITMVIATPIGVGAAVYLNEYAEMAKEIMEADEDVDREQKKIEDICFNLLIQQQPVAKDLRTITAAMKMVTDMERIGDHATNIAEWDHADWQKELDLPDLVRNCDRWVLALLL